MKNSNEMISAAQKALEDIQSGKISKDEGLTMMKLVKVMNDTARTKLQYNKYQSDHSKIEYLEGD